MRSERELAAAPAREPRRRKRPARSRGHARPAPQGAHPDRAGSAEQGPPRRALRPALPAAGAAAATAAVVCAPRCPSALRAAAPTSRTPLPPVQQAAAVTAASAERSGTAVVRITHGDELWAAKTIRWNGDDLSLSDEGSGLVSASAAARRAACSGCTSAAGRHRRGVSARRRNDVRDRSRGRSLGRARAVPRASIPTPARLRPSTSPPRARTSEGRRCAGSPTP